MNSHLYFCGSLGNVVADYAKSCIYIARFYLQTSPQFNGEEFGIQRGQNLKYAKLYLKLVSESNAEEVGIATDLLRRLNKLNID